MTVPGAPPSYSVSPHAEWCDVDGGVVIEHDDRYLSLNSTASYLWGLLLAGADAVVMVSCLREDAGVSAGTAADDVRWFLETLAEHGVVRPRGAASG